jgi:SAM-dependent methyltransferase
LEQYEFKGPTMMQEQDVIFKQSEGNAWFHRNAERLDDGNRPDVVRDMLGLLSPTRRALIGSVCDVGCSAGGRLGRLGSLVRSDTRLCGFDASDDAIATGTKSYPRLDLRPGLVDAPPFTESFDLVIVSFVLHWIDRRRIADAIAAVDHLVAKDGLLIVSDFLPDRPCARRYHHRDDVELYTYKQDYGAAFTEKGGYLEIARHVFPHDCVSHYVDVSDNHNRAMCAILAKTVTDGQGDT